MSIYSRVAPWIMYAFAALVAILVARGIWREFREAMRQDDKEKSARHFRAKMLEYCLIALICVAAFIAVQYLKAGPLKPLSERLYGIPPTTTPNPFYK